MLTKWAIELGEFDIKFMHRTTIKGQATIDFIVEFTYLIRELEMATDTLNTSKGRKKDNEPTDSNNVWSLRIDGSSKINESGTEVILKSPMREKFSYALRLEFPTSNNEAEYKALLAGL